ncbi:MAG: glucose-1-phosphate cytidylyltransferase [Clostridiales bacterium]|jgi:glucose-1-phosphate cytidylyltransferase|nr:glucose-1-phosphate cytidylyltransferase [Clostridiales bacterium]
MKTVILAGGFGTRISEESHLRPKPMVEIGGMPILWHIMKHYSHFGFNDFIICCGYMGYVIKEYFADYYLHRSDVTFDFRNGNEMVIHNNVAEPWRVTLVDTGLNTQTGGRIRRVRPFIGGERFFLTYGDGVSSVDLRALLKTHEESGKTVTVTAIQPGGRFGVLNINDREGSIVGFQEKSKEDGGWINAGFMLMEPDVFDYLDGDLTVLERAPMEGLARAGRLGVYKHQGFWRCMDTARDKTTLEKLWEAGEAEWKLWN